MNSTTHNLLFQEANLAGDAGESPRLNFLKRVPCQRRIAAFLKAADALHQVPRFAEFYELQMAVFVASISAPAGLRIVVAGVTNVAQGEFDQLCASIGRGTSRWNRAEFKHSVETILGITLQDFSGQGPRSEGLG